MFNFFRAIVHPPSGVRLWFEAMRIVVVPEWGTQPANHTANNQSQRPTALFSSCREQKHLQVKRIFVEAAVAPYIPENAFTDI